MTTPPAHPLPLTTQLDETIGGGEKRRHRVFTVVLSGPVLYEQQISNMAGLAEPCADLISELDREEMCELIFLWPALDMLPAH